MSESDDGQRMLDARIREVTEKGMSAVVGDGEVFEVAAGVYYQTAREPAGATCSLTVCGNGRPPSEDYETHFDHGFEFHGWERQPDGTCDYKKYRCEDGVLAEIP
jgi:hypothetical protein